MLLFLMLLLLSPQTKPSPDSVQITVEEVSPEKPKVVDGHLIMDSGVCKVSRGKVFDCELNPGKSLDDMVNELMDLVLSLADDNDIQPNAKEEIEKLSDQDDKYQENYVLTVCEI